MSMRIKVLLAGMAIIVLTNAVALWGAASNRAETRYSIELTERELSLPYRLMSQDENSGLNLRFVWRQPGARPYYTPDLAWLDRDKLNQLGFDLPVTIENSAQAQTLRKALPKEVYLVLEYDGDAYQEMLALSRTEVEEAQAEVQALPESGDLQRKLERAQERLDEEQRRASRLFVVDAGLDGEALQQRYQARGGRFFVMKGKVSLVVNAGRGGYSFTGRILGLSISEVNVPLSLRPGFAAFDNVGRGGPLGGEPRYAVELQVGVRHEPWIASVRPLAPADK